MRMALAFAATYILWGSTFLGAKIAVSGMAPFPMAGARFLLAGVLVLTVVSLKGMPQYVSWPKAIVTGGFFALGTHGILSHVLLVVPSSSVAIFMATVPLFATLLAPRHATGRIWFALALGIIGVAVLVGPQGVAWQQACWMLGAALSWAIGSVLTKKWATGPALPMAGRQMIAGGVLLSLAATLNGEAFTLPDGRTALAIAYLAIGGTIVAYLCYLYLVNRTTVTRASTYTFVNPIVAVALGLLWGEPLTARVVVATPIIVLAVILVMWPPRITPEHRAELTIDRCPRRAAADSRG